MYRILALLDFFNTHKILVLPTLAITLIGLAFWLYGYKIVRFFLSFVGLIAGAVCALYLHKYLVFDNITFWIVLALLSLSLAMFFWLAYRVSFTMAGGFLGAYFIIHYGNIFNFNFGNSILVGALIGGLIALLFCKKFLILGTAWLGSIMIFDSLMAIFNNQNMFTLNFNELYSKLTFQVLGSIVPIIMTVFGYYLQKSKKKKLSN